MVSSESVSESIRRGCRPSSRSAEGSWSPNSGSSSGWSDRIRIRPFDRQPGDRSRVTLLHEAPPFRAEVDCSFRSSRPGRVVLGCSDPGHDGGLGQFQYSLLRDHKVAGPTIET